MSATGLEVFDRTLQTTHAWLNEIMKVVGPDRKLAWKVLSVVLQKLRDRLPVEVAAHLGAQLPLLVRGVYYEQYRPAAQPTDLRTIEEFVAEVQEQLQSTRPVDPKDATRAVFAVLSRHVSEGAISHVKAALPRSLSSSIDSAPALLEQAEAHQAETRPQPPAP